MKAMKRKSNQMINKSQFESLENELDVYAKKRQLNSDLAKQYIDDYFELLLLFLDKLMK